MLKKIALAALFAITFSVGVMGQTNAQTLVQKAPASPVPQGLCGIGRIGC